MNVVTITPVCDASAAHVLRAVCGFHPTAVANCMERNHLSKVHVYADHISTVLHAPHIGHHGHVHDVEPDQFIGRNLLVTTHRPLNPIVEPEVPPVDTDAVLPRFEVGSLRVEHPHQLSSAIVSSVARHESELVTTLAQDSGRLEQSVTSQETRDDPEAFVEDLLEVWYELLAIRPIEAHTAATYGRIASITGSASHPAHHEVSDIADRFERVRRLADGPREFLHGVVELSTTRADTHAIIAAERMAASGVRQNDDMRKISASVAIIAVPTALIGFFGQNMLYPGCGTTAGFVASTCLTIISAAVLYVLFRRKQWL